MNSLSWIGKLFGRLSHLSTGKGRAGKRCSRGIPPQLETLEDRLALTTVAIPIASNLASLPPANHGDAGGQVATLLPVGGHWPARIIASEDHGAGRDGALPDNGGPSISNLIRGHNVGPSRMNGTGVSFSFTTAGVGLTVWVGKAPDGDTGNPDTTKETVVSVPFISTEVGLDQPPGANRT